MYTLYQNPRNQIILNNYIDSPKIIAKLENDTLTIRKNPKHHLMHTTNCVAINEELLLNKNQFRFNLIKIEIQNLCIIRIPREKFIELSVSKQFGNFEPQRHLFLKSIPSEFIKWIGTQHPPKVVLLDRRSKKQKAIDESGQLFLNLEGI